MTSIDEVVAGGGEAGGGCCGECCRMGVRSGVAAAGASSLVLGDQREGGHRRDPLEPHVGGLCVLT